MQYQVYFERRHLTETCTKEIGEHSFDIARSESRTVIVDIDYDPLSSARQSEFIDSAKALYDTRHPNEGEWEQTKYLGAHEFHETPPLPALLTPKDSFAYTLGLAYAKEYPLLFGIDELAIYRVWDQWLNVNGNGIEWSAEGILVDCSGRRTKVLNPQNRTLSSLSGAARLFLAQPLSPEEQSQLQEAIRYRAHRVEPFPGIPVKLHTSGRGYMRIFEIPDNVEDSLLTASLDLCRYFLSRPIWQCCTQDPAYLCYEEGRQVYDRDLHWRSLALADGATARAVVADAYEMLVLGQFRRRCLQLGYVDERLSFDARLPPQWVPPLKASPEILASQDKIALEILAEVLAEERAGSN